MISDIVFLPVTALLSVTAPALPQYNQSDQAVLDRPVRTNRANRENIRLCVDGVSLELKPSVDKDFLRVPVMAVHYAKDADVHSYTGACIFCGTTDFLKYLFLQASQYTASHPCH